MLNYFLPTVHTVESEFVVFHVRNFSCRLKQVDCDGSVWFGVWVF